MTSWPHRILLPVVFAISCGVSDESIECRSSAVCDLAAGGSCRVAPTGRMWCAYVDLSCSGGARWSAQAGDGLGGTCAGGGQLFDAPHGATVDAGGSPDSASSDAPPDVSPPETTITSRPSAISGADVVFMFESDDITATFECSLDGVPFEACESPRQYTALGASPKPHVFRVRAKDPAGNTDPSPAEFEWEVDPNALDTTITSAPSAISGPAVSFSFSSTRPGTFECRLAPDETAFSVCSSPKTYGSLTDSTNPKTFSVRAIDGAQNVDDTPATYTWNVDSTGPTTTIASPAGTVGATSQISFVAEPQATYRCRIDSAPPFTCTPGIATPSLPQGPHVVYVQGTDSLGNVGAEASRAFTVDVSPPTFTSFNAPAEDGISDPMTTITYALSDGEVASCAIDGRTPSSGCSSPIALTGLVVGEHTFAITARDAVGNSVTLRRTWAVPPAANFQSADLVLGQNGDYTTNTANLGGVSGTSFDNVVSLDRHQSGMWVSDANNCRVVFFAPVPIVSTASALIALGQESLMTNTCQMQGAQFPPNAVKLDAGSFVCTTSSRVYVSDVFSNRIMVWNLPVNVSGEPADLVLGQDDFVTKTRGNGADQLDGPFGLWCDDTRLIVADGGNNRVLIWTATPTMNGEPADIVLGFPDFGMSGPAIPAPTRDTMYTPYGVHYDGQRLYVAEFSNHRVLVWNAMPTASGTPPSFVLGQGSFTTNSPGTGRDGLDQPRDVVTYKDSLLVSDRGNRRVVMWTPIPTETGEKPRAVLGAADLDSAAPAVGSEKVFFNGPRGLTIDGTKLFVADGNRILRFQLRN